MLYFHSMIFLKGIYEPVKRGIVAPNSFINYDFAKNKISCYII